ncbi:F-box/LRR-repeat protein 15-like [Tripterygium wilfordii]|uniref:F-box/LRR-repeat protein 15-like n=1 Tax=Tripterygium wilfordii TaxID=458696 RepID=A0A7J7CAD6_TRIWF|nr:F-box/LRR-repeat protein 15-like [Tripterygium wilfordii]
MIASCILPWKLDAICLSEKVDAQYNYRRGKNRLFEDMCRRFPKAIEVNMYGVPATPLLIKAASSLRNLKTLTLGGEKLGETFFHPLAKFKLLKSLIVNDATLGNGRQEILINHDSLRILEVTKCRVTRIGIRCPQLHTLSLKQSDVAWAVLNCPLLRLLDISSCNMLSNTSIRSAVTSCLLLESLDMSNCSNVVEETLREIAITCRNLCVLDASYCPDISLSSVRQLPKLTVLKVHGCERITSASMAAISHSSMLEVLELGNCSFLTSVSLDLPRLRSIRLADCRKLSDLNLQCTMLSSIMVSHSQSIRRINIASNSLEKLALQGQENLTTLALRCQCLQLVDLTGCVSLANSICEVLSDGGGCPMLKSLILDNCETLTALQFRSTSLVSLSLIGCRSVTALELNCPSLQQVNLDGCDNLQRASFCPVGLRSINVGILPKLNVLTIEAPLMVMLEMKGCGVLAEASINCPLLTCLDASFCSQLKGDCLSSTAASCPLIESLLLGSCPSAGPSGLYFLRSLLHLTMLDLSYSFFMNLQPVFESCLLLKVLKLQACKNPLYSSLEPLYKEDALPALRELDLSYGTPFQSTIEDLLACCTHLTHVSLNGCLNMHDINWGSSGSQLSTLPGVYDSSALSSQENMHHPLDQPNHLLQTLNCVGCPNLSKVFIPPAASFFHLSSLNLSLSAKLKDVDIACFNLCFLNLSNCRSLEILKLQCPRLTSLLLQSCNIGETAVEAAIKHCSKLETLDVRYCPKICSVSVRRLRTACPSLKRIFSSMPRFLC